MDVACIRSELEACLEELELTRAEVVKLEGLALRCRQGHGVFRSAPVPGVFALDLHQEARALLSWVRFRGGKAVSAHDGLEAELAEPGIGLGELRHGLVAARELVDVLESHEGLRVRAEDAFARIDDALGAKARRASRESPSAADLAWPPGTPEEVAALAPRVDETLPARLLRKGIVRLRRGGRRLRRLWSGGLRLAVGSMAWSGVVVMLALAGDYEEALNFREIEARYFAQLTSDSIRDNTVAIGDLQEQVDAQAGHITRRILAAQAHSCSAPFHREILKELSDLRRSSSREPLVTGF